MSKQWYVIHTYSGYENKVKANLEKRIASMNMGDKIFRIIVPEEDEIEIKGGKKQVLKRRIFPGYVLVEMILTDESWYVVRNTPGVTGFVGSGNKPLPLTQAEAEEILKRMEGESPRIRLDVTPGEKIRVTSGPFQNFIGVVEEVNAEKAKLKVLISMFGREVPIELDYSQIEKIV
ncbi:transcription termination/antitermination protein NusG [Thermodesulfitimonas autotrophica]|uniref:Transcription termination/antitermination protein NusG n=1 Tax=Thermodesulfitimonas autotrophica TaxID=1894989 RepID=A0A3N5ABH8_9THEO|nr:transcription termination/antitermination protein NusG [Thermodesulfitimonas autotrophica]RPF42949.1 transcription antitermination protein nusG [Thermodesulfitimonas autotrophica]